MNRVAAIDIGTNSTRLLVAEKAGPVLKALETGLTTTRLGEGIGGGKLSPAAMDRTARAIEQFRQTALGLGAGQVVAAATSAVRDAVNQKDFLELVRGVSGLQVRVLSGEEEAELSYRGVLSGLAVDPLSSAVMDVGGGSTELIWRQGELLRLSSVNAGAVRMTEGGLDEEAIMVLLAPALGEVRRSPVQNLVGVGGTVTTLAAVDQELAVYEPQRVHGYSLTAARVNRMMDRLKKMDIEERMHVPGLQPERADIIVAGIAIVKTVMKGLGLDSILVSECDILYGLVLKEVETN